MAKRQGLSKRVRFAVFARDQYVCRYCGHHPPDVKLEVDHVIPVCEGGSNDMANLVTSCFACNRGKGATSLGVSLPPVDEITLRAEMQEAMERAYDMRAAVAAAEVEAATRQEALETITEHIEQQLGCDVEVRSLRIFLQRMEIDEIYAAVDTTVGRSRAHWRAYDLWRYFCGVCWRMIKEREAA